MGFVYEDYLGDEGFSRFSEISDAFDFGPHLVPASFPRSFVDAYVASLETYEDDCDYFVAVFPHGSRVFWLESIDDPAHIHSQNAILSESIYADEGSAILPPGFYSFGSAVDKSHHWQIMVCLDEKSPQYEEIHLWRRAYDPLGEGDNTEPMGFVAKDLADFLKNLGPRANFF